MQSAEPTFRRARRPEHKEQRYQSILTAARTLGLRNGVRSVSLTDIGAEAGIAKSAVRRYFETREEIYLHLTAEGWHDWAQAMRGEIDDASDISPADLAAALARSLADRPLFCDLLAHTTLTLERHVSIEVVRAFKLRGLAAVDELAALILAALPAIGRRGARDLIAVSTALAAALWQTAHPPQTVVQLYAEDPRLGHSVTSFAPRLERLIHAVIVGLIETADGQ
jgi:AcrR family transcriptional regulator